MPPLTAVLLDSVPILEAPILSRKNSTFVRAVRGPTRCSSGRGNSINPHFVPALTKPLYGSS